jgi:hypothetical protein
MSFFGHLDQGRPACKRSSRIGLDWHERTWRTLAYWIPQSEDFSKSRSEAVLSFRSNPGASKTSFSDDLLNLSREGTGGTNKTPSRSQKMPTVKFNRR